MYAAAKQRVAKQALEFAAVVAKPRVQKMPQASLTPKAPHVSQTPKTPQAPWMLEFAAMVAKPWVLKTPQTSLTLKTPQVPQTLKTPQVIVVKPRALETLLPPKTPQRLDPSAPVGGREGREVAGRGMVELQVGHRTQQRTVATS